MRKRRIEAREAIEAYISDKGYICIKQDGYMGAEDDVIVMDPRDVPTIIKWLQELLGERENFVPVEDAEGDS